MKLKQFTVNPLGVNCYIISDNTHEGVIIDCGTFDKAEILIIEQYLKDEQIQLKHHLLTHAHFDHIFGCEMLYKVCNIPPKCHSLEREIWKGNSELSRVFCGYELPLPNVLPQFSLCDEEEISFGHTKLRVIHTPGHTPGSVCFYCESHDLLFSGDTLFQDSIGRTDMPLGNMQQEILSIRNRLAVLHPSTKVYPGHGMSTTIAHELENNHYLI